MNFNFYGKVAGSQHTIYGRIAPMMEAMRLAICRAAAQPLPLVNIAPEFPEWAHCITDELTCTVFKGIVNLAPVGKKHQARKAGQIFGLHLRLGLFFWKDVAGILEREGLTKLTAEQEAKLDKIAGWEHACVEASKQAGRPIKTKTQFIKYTTRRVGRFALHTFKVCMGLVKFTLHQPVADVLDFLSGIPEGFKCFLNTEGEFAKTGKRTEIFFVLLMYWPEIEEMRQAQPPVTRPFLLKWLNEQEGKELSDDKIFSGICDDIHLNLAPPGHPFGLGER